MNKNLRISLLFVIAVISVGVALFASNHSFFQNLENRTVDLRMLFRDVPETIESKAVVILIDEATLKNYPYRSPVPRDMLADLISILSKSGAKLIALDVFLKDRTWNKEDAQLRQAMFESGNIVLVSAIREKESGNVLDQANDYFLEAALGSGLSDMPIDPADQIVRKMRSAYEVEGKSIPTLSSTLYSLLEKKNIQEKNFTINFSSPPSTAGIEGNSIKTFPASAVLTGLLPAEWFQDKVVLIGAGYEDNTDSYRTPFYTGKYNWALTPGVEIHATALHTLLAGDFIQFLESEKIFLIALLLCMVLLLTEFLTNTVIAGIALLLLGTSYGGYAFYVFEASNLALPMVSVYLALVLSFITAVVYRGLTEGRQKRWIQNAFGMYISPELVKILVNKPGSMTLGGEEKEVTVLFSDLEGFTTISEGLSPTELVTLLNEYLDGMTNIIIRHKGTLDKYEGDAIMAFWGAPVDDPNHAQNAVQAAIEMQEFSRTLNQRFQKEGKPSLRTRIGINTGKAVVGNIGSKKRFDYTLIGDEVNLASRLEGANKQYKTLIMVGERTHNLMEAQILSRELDLIRVKGKQQPVKVFEILENQQADTAEELLKIYQEALRNYRERNWEKAEELFIKALSLQENDGPSKTYLERCITYKKNPPHKDWDGVFIMQTK